MRTLSATLLMTLLLLAAGCGDSPAPVDAGPIRGAPLFRPDPEPDAESESGTTDAAGDAESTSSEESESPSAEATPEPEEAVAATQHATVAPRKHDLPPGVAVVTFDFLASYEYPIPDNGVFTEETLAEVDRIPPAVRKLDGTRVAIEGYMMPLKIHEDRVENFILSRSTFGCCFGDYPTVNELILVEMTDARNYPESYGGPVLVTGRIEVGERLNDRGFLLNVYRVKGEAVKELEWD